MRKDRGWRLQGGQYLGEISALSFLHLPSHFSDFPFLLAGTGSQILLFDISLRRLIKSFHVFEGIRVHGIFCSDVNKTDGAFSSTAAFEIALFGEKRVKLFRLHFELVSRSQDDAELCINLTSLQELPKFSHWVLDICFFENNKASSQERCHCLAVGCSDNSVCIWDIATSTLILEVRCPERCLVYSMHLWQGGDFHALCVASGTINNEIVLWKVAHQHYTQPSAITLDDPGNVGTIYDAQQFVYHQREGAIICRLAGHQGSIFRITCSADGSKLVSVSDDRSARIWTANTANGCGDVRGGDILYSADHVLFGHNARVWDCCIFDHLIVTAGEDCTCRIWGLDGRELWMTKDHIGRGIWRCLYDPSSSLLVTAGFDSAVEVHQLYASLSGGLGGVAKQVYQDREEAFVLYIPNSSGHVGLVDSKSEYVRCLRFACEDAIYVATNRGYVYHAKLSKNESIKWTELLQVRDSGPIVCMDLLSADHSTQMTDVGDWIAVGDGKGGMTVIKVYSDDHVAKVGHAIRWSAEIPRQLLGAYWCKSLGCGYIFTSDPRGLLTLWMLSDPLQSLSQDHTRSYDVYLVTQFKSSFGARIMCLDASVEDEVLVCGDLRGNLLLFPLSKSMLLDRSVGSAEKMLPLTYFKGAHGISTVSSVSLSRCSPNLLDICSTGADGCICYLEYDKGQQMLEFVGMKQAKELSLIQSVSVSGYTLDDSANRSYAVGFSSTDFLIWNLVTETKVVQIKCGGWRRPHSYYLGCIPEINYCFAYVKDEIIYIHRYRVPESEKRIFPQNLHLQFHGREVHSLCFISHSCQFTARATNSVASKSIWIATGCEDGTVRLNRYIHGAENWTTSKLLGEHVGGSAVRSMCFVSMTHLVGANATGGSNGMVRLHHASKYNENSFLLISVGAKRVLTSWLLRNRQMKGEGTANDGLCDESRGLNFSLEEFSSMSFKWLSTDMPTKCVRNTNESEKLAEPKKVPFKETNASSVSPDLQNEEKYLKLCKEAHDNDWRYLAVTAFLVKLANSRLTVCFTVVACSDATLALKALVLPYRLWFEVAFLVPLSSPVLALQNVVIPFHFPFQGHPGTGSKNVFIVISGSTDGSIAFWDISETVEAFMQQIPSLDLMKSTDFQKRPRTGRGSQGGRWWRSTDVSVSETKLSGGSTTSNAKVDSSDNMLLGTSSRLKNSKGNAASCSHAVHTASPKSEANSDNFLPKLYEIMPLHVLNNAHQSGVNCLFVSDNRSCQSSENGLLYNVVSGGDDQALALLKFDLAAPPTTYFGDRRADAETGSLIGNINYLQNQSFRMRILCQHKVASAHSSAVKGVWTDGSWVFSVGLDQRVRCWHLHQPEKLTEHSHFIVCVPEPESLDARACERNLYQIVVAGRGMQALEFTASHNSDGE